MFLALDIHTERFDTINFNPNSSMEKDQRNGILLNLAEKLAIVKVDVDPGLVRIWEITGSKANGRWFKQCASFSLAIASNMGIGYVLNDTDTYLGWWKIFV